MRKNFFGTVVAIAACLVVANRETTARSSKLFDGDIGGRVAQAIAPSPQVRQFASGTSYALCFVPDGPSCENMVVNAIRNTRQSLLIQAYEFTSAPIAKAVIEAHNRGVDVKVIVDKSQVSSKYSSATFLSNAGIPVVVDAQPAIAHNKVMIFDQQAVFTGSFNFTKSAQERNAENGIIISGDGLLVKDYTDNWVARRKQSSPYAGE